MAIKLDQHLNLVIPVEQDKGTVYVHSAPIGKAVFDRFFLVISKTFTRIHTEGLGIVGGPRVAMMLLRDTAKNMGEAEADAVERGLISEIRRLSNLVTFDSGGWRPMPFQDALDGKLMSEGDISEVENALAFFTVGSWMYPRRALETIIAEAGQIWGAQISSLNCTEYATSLKTSTGDGSTGEKATPSPVPY